MSLKEFKKKLMKDPEFKEEYEKLEFEFQVKRAMLDARISKNISNKDLAEKIGTKPANITKFERGSYKPSYEFLYGIVKALGNEVKISIVWAEQMS